MEQEEVAGGGSGDEDGADSSGTEISGEVASPNIATSDDTK